MSSNSEDIKTPTESNSATPENSLLGEILNTWEPQSFVDTPVDLLSDSFIPDADIMNKETSTITNAETPPVNPEVVKKSPKKSMSTKEFLQIIGAMLSVALIFFGAFLSYIVFNPGQASFFISFGINPGDIALWLSQLVRAIFWVATFVIAIIWIIFLFRAILTKKEYKKKKTISIILSWFFGILLFSEMYLWAFLEQKINATDYENPNGGIIVYDNEKLNSERFKDMATMNDFNNLIGPLELRFELKADANFVGKIINIEKYKIDFDGAKCQWRDSSIVEWVNAQADQSIICIFDQARIFRPTGVYEWFDRVTREPKTIPMNFQTIQIIWVVDIKKPKTYKDKAITYDASHLTSLGKISWYTEKNGDTPVSVNPVFSITMNKDVQVLCLNILSGKTCDKVFLIPKEADANVTAKIVHEQDQERPFKYLFYLEDKIVKVGEITRYEWIVDNIIVSREETCDFDFLRYRDVSITLLIYDSAGNTTELKDEFSIPHPLILIPGASAKSLLKISDNLGLSLIDNTYDSSLKAYYITNLITPMTVQFDATDVKVEATGYELDTVNWDMNGDGEFEMSWNRIKYEFKEWKRYDITVHYNFINKVKKITSIMEEKIIFELEKNDKITLSLNLVQDSEYAPTTIHVDGSASVAKEGSITKFMYDFGEGKWFIEGDAIQDYHYNFPWEYTITFVAVRDDGIKSQSLRKIVLKDTPKRILLNTSVSSGIVGKPIDFDTNGTIGQIGSYSWDFWDGNISSESSPTHTYLKWGRYTVKITVVYADNTEWSTHKEILIVD